MPRLELIVLFVVHYVRHLSVSGISTCDTTYGKPCTLQCVFSTSATQGCWFKLSSSSARSEVACLHLVPSSTRRETILWERQYIALSRINETVRLTFFFKMVTPYDVGNYVCQVGSENQTVSVTAVNETYHGEEAMSCPIGPGVGITLTCLYTSTRSDFHGCWTRYLPHTDYGTTLVPDHMPCIDEQHARNRTIRVAPTDEYSSHRHRVSTLQWIGDNVSFSLQMMPTRVGDTGIYECRIRGQTFAYFNLSCDSVSPYDWYEIESLSTTHNCTATLSESVGNSLKWWESSDFSESSQQTRSDSWTVPIVAVIVMAGIVVIGIVLFFRRRFRVERRFTGPVCRLFDR